MSEADEDIQIIDFSKEKTKKVKKEKKDKVSKIGKNQLNHSYFIDEAANKGEESKQGQTETKKVSLLVAEGHQSYEYSEMLDRISELLKGKIPQS